LKQFYNQYPEFKGRDFYLVGESFAGKYHSLFTHDILTDNEKMSVSDINLKGTILFDPMPATGL
jgi:serine carboxypeptidase-like clade 2